MINLNQAASSFPKAPGVADAVHRYLAEGAFNVQRGGGQESLAVGDVVFDTRRLLASFFGAKSPKQVCFTAGVTAALNMIVYSWLNPGDHVICSSLEHNAVLRPLAFSKTRGIDYSLVEAAKDGTVTASQFADLIRPDTRAVIVTTASNVCGTILPLSDIAALCRDRSIALIVDSAQTAGVMPLSLEDGIDAVCFTGHKGLLGPQGIGGIVMSPSFGEAIRPFIYGGTGSRSDSLDMPVRLPDKLEAGTLNLPGIVGLKAAIEYILDVGMDYLATSKRDLTSRFLEGVKAIPGVRVIGPADPCRQVAVVSIDVPAMDNALVAAALDEKGIVTRSGLHCAPLAHQSLGTFPEGTVRFSFGSFNMAEEIDEALNALELIVT